MKTIETERLILRKFEEKDLKDLYEYLSDEQTLIFEPYKPLTLAEAEIELNNRINNDEMIAVELKSERKVIGNVYFGERDFRAKEIGFVFNRKYWKNGFAHESCQAVIKNAFKNGTHRIFAECDPKNEASWKLLSSLGFVREGYLKQNIYFWSDENGVPQWKDTYIYSLLNEK